MEEKQDENWKIAVFIDVQNMDASTNFDALFTKLDGRGKVDLKMAYAEWKEVGMMLRKSMLRHHVKQIQTSWLTTSGKNGADMQIVIDVMNALHEKEDIDTFVIAAGDTDYVPLINEIASRGKRCIVAGHEGKIGSTVKECCHEFIPLESLVEKKGTIPDVPVVPVVVTTKPENAASTRFGMPSTGTAVKNIGIINSSIADHLASKPVEPSNPSRKRRGVTIENDISSLTLFPEIWLAVLDAMEQCCCHGIVDFTSLRNYIDRLIEDGELAFSKTIVVPVLNTFVKQELFVQPSRGRIVIADDFERKRTDFIKKFRLE